MEGQVNVVLSELDRELTCSTGIRNPWVFYRHELAETLSFRKSEPARVNTTAHHTQPARSSGSVNGLQRFVRHVSELWVENSRW